MNENKELLTKIGKIQGAIGSLVKDEAIKSTHTNYKYFEESQVLKSLKPLLTEQKLTMIISDDDTQPLQWEKEGNQHFLRYLKKMEISDYEQLISKAVNDNEKQKQFLNSLFRKLEEIKEIETMERLREYEGGKYLKAYLLYKSFSRANYQAKHLKLNNYQDINDYLEAMNKDIELLEPKEEKPLLPTQPTSEQLLIMISERMRMGEIKREECDCDDGFVGLFVEDKGGQELMRLNLLTGKITPDPVNQLLEKHG
ncbi:11194_t:CDS:2 [Ambispora gerdemannii]|uniref:11194_t:CDS:1 n=1 Tax=Ambispora gerdemannii TaxID=144530 RepID=A0A9N8W023_9GLOM|nr:11194_t:CDS:2 [Ambispora gerdemannii]